MASREPPAETPEAFDAGHIEAHREYLLRYAQLQLRDSTAAEDAVQETLLAALQNRAGFSGRSSVKTWLTGILKHKIVDHLRRQSREQPLQYSDEESTDAAHDLPDAVFGEDGHWREFPAHWDAPERSCENAEFWRVFETCVEAMPPRAARVFIMREMLELSTEEICKELGITATNCWVVLHRARLSLRECLEGRWFRA